MHFIKEKNRSLNTEQLNTVNRFILNVKLIILIIEPNQQKQHQPTKPTKKNNTTQQQRKMHLKYYIDTEGKRVYTLQNVDPAGKPTLSAHPARFSPDDKYSKYRILLKKRFGILLTQTPTPSA